MWGPDHEWLWQTDAEGRRLCQKGRELLVVAPSGLTDAHKEALLYYGSTADRALLQKALHPDPSPVPVPSKPAPSPFVSKARLEKALSILAAETGKRLRERDEKIASLEARLLELEADRAVKRELVP